MIAKTGQIIPVLQESKNLMPGSKTSYLIIKKAYKINKDGRLENCEDDAKHKISNVVFNEDELGESLKDGSDLLPPKEKVSIIIKGEAVNPGISNSFVCGFALSDHKKEIRVIGDRTLTLYTDQSFDISEAEMLQSVPLRYELSYGGNEFKRNPHGTGYLNDLFPQTLQSVQKHKGMSVTGVDEAAQEIIAKNLQKLADDFEEVNNEKPTILDKQIAITIRLPNFESIDENIIDPLKTYTAVNLCADPVDWSVSWTIFEKQKEADDFFIKSRSKAYTPDMYYVVPHDQLVRQFDTNERIELINLSSPGGGDCVFFPDEYPRVVYNIKEDLNRELYEPQVFQDTVEIDLTEGFLIVTWKCDVEFLGKTAREKENLTEYVCLTFEHFSDPKNKEEIKLEFEENTKLFDEFKKRSKFPGADEVDAKVEKIKEALVVVLQDAKVDQVHIDVLNSDLSLPEVQKYFFNLVDTLGSEAMATIKKVTKSHGI